MADRRAERGTILVVDDDAWVLRGYTRVLERAGFRVVPAATPAEAIARATMDDVDAVLSDVQMPGMDGLDLLKVLRERAPTLPVLLMTGNPDAYDATADARQGTVRYLPKPVEAERLREELAAAVAKRRVTMMTGTAPAEPLGPQWRGESSGESREAPRTLIELDRAFERALDGLWMAYQPVVFWCDRRVESFESLVRTTETAFGGPAALFDAAERLYRLPDLGRRIRALVARIAPSVPGAFGLSVNMHPADLFDEDMYAPGAPLSQVAPRVVLELNERASLHRVADMPERLAALRRLGFRLALDDLSDGCAAASNLACLRPEVVKMDMSVVRGIDGDLAKLAIARDLAGRCADIGASFVAEGVETVEEREALCGAGCDLFQGYLFGRPSPSFTLPDLPPP